MSYTALFVFSVSFSAFHAFLPPSLGRSIVPHDLCPRVSTDHEHQHLSPSDDAGVDEDCLAVFHLLQCQSPCAQTTCRHPVSRLWTCPSRPAATSVFVSSVLSWRSKKSTNFQASYNFCVRSSTATELSEVREVWHELHLHPAHRVALSGPGFSSRHPHVEICVID